MHALGAANRIVATCPADRTLTLVKMVAAANYLPDPDHITVGEVIFFPSFELGG